MNGLMFVAPGIIMAIIGTLIYLLCLVFGDPVPDEINPVPHCKHFSIEREHLGNVGTEINGYSVCRCRNCDSFLAFGYGTKSGKVIQVTKDQALWSVLLGYDKTT